MPGCGLRVYGFYSKTTVAAGRKVFLEHLFDGDAASNTLSWRWVAGLQTKGKKLLSQVLEYQQIHVWKVR